MDPPQSPPKRMTRARAAKATESSSTSKTAKIVTAAAKAKATRSTTTSGTSAKRKTRADESEDAGNHHEDGELAQPGAAMNTRIRGRPKKAVAEPEPEVARQPAPAPRARGRPRKAVEPSEEEPQPAKPTTRATRAKKTAQPEEDRAPEPEKKPATRTRGSATAATKSTAAKSAAKKTVKFEEPEKENIAPTAAKTSRTTAAGTTTTTATGLRAKPVRRTAASAATKTSTRCGAAAKTAAAQVSKYEKPTPLSPKKVTQMAMHNRATVTESEDELAADDEMPAKPTSKLVPSARVRGGFKLPPPRQESNQTSDEEEMASQPAVMLGSPCRRPPPSPWKDSMKTPAKRVDGVPALSQSALRPSSLFDGETGHQLHQLSPPKTTLLRSPAKRPQSPIKSLDPHGSGVQLTAPSPFKSSLMSPPKRPLSPSKPSFLGLGPPAKEEDQTGFGWTPAPKPTLLATPLPAGSAVDEEKDVERGPTQTPENAQQGETLTGSPSRLLFPGRMSAVLPRHADPALQADESDDMECQEHHEEHVEDNHVVAEEVEAHIGDLMLLDEPEPAVAPKERETTAPPASPPKQTASFFGLREKDLEPHNDDIESEDEDDHRFVATHNAISATPCPATSRTPVNRPSTRRLNFGERSTAKRARVDDKFRFTPLANQLSAWNAGPSPPKTVAPESSGTGILCDEDDAARMVPHSQIPAATSSPVRNTYFEEAMAGQPATVAEQTNMETETQVETNPVEDYAQTEFRGVLTPELDDVPLTEEDVALAAEAHEMSLLEPEQVEEHIAHDDSLSEASQEYGDENAIPIDPTLLVPPATPPRNFIGMREFHTVSKVPLKPADDSTPRPRIKKRSHSISRLPAQRPTQELQRNATVISYSNAKQSTTLEAAAPPVTPAKSEAGAGSWSNAATPARTPRRDLNPALLGGAVVFVDVHTSEGADASGIFVELLAQMGARCVKSWPWNPSSPPSDGAGSHGKIGITHVVFKDGSKRTLEKVRESGGVVQCVGVSWVLDCERENKWLDEAPYYIDTGVAPRDGARRRKSMEPKALANMNGMLVATTPSSKPAASTSAGTRDRLSAPATPVNGGTSRRRDSSLWMRTPPEQSLDADADADADWDEGASFLTPVPKTPAPEAVARYAAAVALAATPTMTVYDDDDQGEGRGQSDRRVAMMTRTCPPPKSTSVYHELGDGILAREKDERVLMRLMAARRKSLQFAPKVGSPLARAWE